MDIIRAKVAKASQAVVAAELGISRGYLSELLLGRRQPGDKILDALGLEMTVTYRRKPNGQKAPQTAA